ncbi:MAG: DUF4974 domain-containing protein [Candidatus Pedobacter colombiensis]|uniref:DUF4974 domain-containing protein n=1 Tax=Candidatus Pedobacter colombiensis TaxID=3121371 RepID=A0AAJ6B994_9SPHI|nr:FecR family protein [Pedobacter sp.]WEK19938.1 MAG: DUF4974 domain-containing protein [Pedobacter sp.]
MNKTKDLLDRYLNDKCTPLEQQQVENWLAAYHNDDNGWQKMNIQQKEIWLDALFTDINNIIDTPQQQTKTLNNYRFIRRKIFTAAAAILILSTIGIYFFAIRNQQPHSKSDITYKNDIGPGKNQATLTLADGRKIILSDTTKGELATEAGVSITKTKDGQIVYQVNSEISDKQYTKLATKTNTIATPRGGQYQINLPDGTKVWLNAASTLQYPTFFGPLKERKVILSGEAYFEVAKDKTKPFIVVTARQEVEVLGTHFNVNSYEDNAIVKTTLLEGSVRISPYHLSKGSKLSMLAPQILKPNEQAILTDGNLKIQEADIKEAVAWKNGYFIFNDENLGSIMHKISRWYDVDVSFQDNTTQVSFIGVVSRAKNISSVLQLIEETGNVHFKIDGRRITVMK